MRRIWFGVFSGTRQDGGRGFGMEGTRCFVGLVIVVEGALLLLRHGVYFPWRLLLILPCSVPSQEEARACLVLFPFRSASVEIGRDISEYSRTRGGYRKPGQSSPGVPRGQRRQQCSRRSFVRVKGLRASGRRRCCVLFDWCFYRVLCR